MALTAGILSGERPVLTEVTAPVAIAFIDNFRAAMEATGLTTYNSPDPGVTGWETIMGYGSRTVRFECYKHDTNTAFCRFARDNGSRDLSYRSHIYAVASGQSYLLHATKRQFFLIPIFATGGIASATGPGYVAGGVPAVEGAGWGADALASSVTEIWWSCGDWPGWSTLFAAPNHFHRATICEYYTCCENGVLVSGNELVPFGGLQGKNLSLIMLTPAARGGYPRNYTGLSITGPVTVPHAPDPYQFDGGLLMLQENSATGSWSYEPILSEPVLAWPFQIAPVDNDYIVLRGQLWDAFLETKPATAGDTRTMDGYTWMNFMQTDLNVDPYCTDIRIPSLWLVTGATGDKANIAF